MSTKFPPVPLAHKPGCALAPADAVLMDRDKALNRWVGLRSCRCVLVGRSAVLIEHVTYPDHKYEGTMFWPAGAARSLCATCHGDHLADDNPYLLADSWAPRQGEDPR